MKKKRIVTKGSYLQLLEDIRQTITRAKKNAAIAVNHQLVQANWLIGRHIVQYEQRGNERAEYGSKLLARLSADLRMHHGKGFGRRNVLDMRRFYIVFPIWQTVSAKLSWSHYITLLAVTDDSARKFYFELAIRESWSCRELERQIGLSLYERAMLSRRKRMLPDRRKKPVKLSPEHAVKDPYVLDFLGIPPGRQISEKQLEQYIINNLQAFILELGKGFAFVARQYPILIGSNHFRVDLLFYHRVLKCFVLFDLKTRPVRHTDIGQMNLYLNYFRAEENMQGDNEPVGVILSAGKDEVLVEYAMGGISNKIFVSKYQLHLPDKKDLQERMQNILTAQTKKKRQK